jgi:hypothetical protein
MLTFEVSGYSFVMGPKVFTKEAAYDNIKPIKYKDMFKVPLTFEQEWNHPCPWQRACWRCAACVYRKGQTKCHPPWAQMH